MKRMILLIMTCLPLFAVAQEQELLNKYSAIEGCATIELSKEMIQSMGGGQGIDSLFAISVEKESLIAEFTDEVTACTKGMSKILSVVQNSQRVAIYCNRSNQSQKIVKMLIFTTDNTTAVMVILTGDNIELNNLSSLINVQI